MAAARHLPVWTCMHRCLPDRQPKPNKVHPKLADYTRLAWGLHMLIMLAKLWGPPLPAAAAAAFCPGVNQSSAHGADQQHLLQEQPGPEESKGEAQPQHPHPAGQQLQQQQAQSAARGLATAPVSRAERRALLHRISTLYIERITDPANLLFGLVVSVRLPHRLTSLMYWCSRPQLLAFGHRFTQRPDPFGHRFTQRPDPFGHRFTQRPDQPAARLLLSGGFSYVTLTIPCCVQLPTTWRIPFLAGSACAWICVCACLPTSMPSADAWMASLESSASVRVKEDCVCVRACVLVRV